MSHDSGAFLNLLKATNAKKESSSRLRLHPEHRCVASTEPSLHRAAIKPADEIAPLGALAVYLVHRRLLIIECCEHMGVTFPTTGKKVQHVNLEVWTFKPWLSDASSCFLSLENHRRCRHRHHLCRKTKGANTSWNRSCLHGNNCDRHTLCLLRGGLLEKHQNDMRSVWFLNIKQCSARGASRMITNTISGSLSSPTEDGRQTALWSNTEGNTLEKHTENGCNCMFSDPHVWLKAPRKKHLQHKLCPAWMMLTVVSDCLSIKSIN